MSTHNSVLIEEVGSGKTEIAVDLTLRLVGDTPVSVRLVDMGQTKCMLRARDFSSLLERGYIHMVVNPELRGSSLTSQGITSLLKDDSICRVFDAGGNVVGAVALGRFTDLTAEEGTSYHYIISPCHAFSGGVRDILESLSAILISVRIPTEGLKFITNPFMGEYTTPELIMEYIRHLEAELGKAGLKLRGLTVSERFLGEVKKLTGLPILELNMFVDKLYVWMKRSMRRSVERSPYES